MVLIDCHAHLSSSELQGSLETILKECDETELFVVNVGMSYNDFGDVIKLEGNNVCFGLGLHPIQGCGENKRHLTVKDTIDLEEWLCQHADQAVCLGECGLDFSRWLCPTSTERDEQKEALEKQITFSKRFDLPLNLHSRSAGKPLLELLRKHSVRGALLHAFDGGRKAINQGIADGHYFSVAPSIVRDPSQQQVAMTVPRDRIVLESDSPALGPEKGATNTPLNLKLTVTSLAELWGCSVEEVARITTENALRLFPRLKRIIRL
eukprot:sb/3468317/